MGAAASAPNTALGSKPAPVVSSSTGASGEKSVLPSTASTSKGPACELDALLQQNRQWAADRVTEDPAYFRRLQNIQAPRWLWIGCADSRVPANVIMGLQPGEVFVQRNVGNQATHTDMNVMACLEYAVKQLRVKTIICCGHYGCNAVKAALQMPSKAQGIVNCWISDIRECRNQHQDELQMLPPTQRIDRLCELNVIRQCFHLCTSPVVQNAWDQGQDITVYGLVYGLRDGLVHKLVGPLTGNNASTELHGYKQSYCSSNADGQQGGWTSEPIKAFETGHDHGADCNCVAEPVAGPAKGAADRTAHLASKIAAHTGWQAPGGRRTEAKKELNPWA